MPKIVRPVRRRVAVFAALASLAIVAAPSEWALGQKPSTPVTVTNPQVPVTVDNPATNPVPTSVVNPATMPALTSSIDDPGRIAYQNTMTSTNCMSGTQCNFVFPNVPVGHRLVVQHISGSLNMIGTPSVVVVNLSGPRQGISFFAPFVSNVSSFDQPVLLYFDSGESVGVGISLFATNFTFDQNMTLIGYLLDCVASPCAAIAH
jgi:hypothetical protein